MAHKMTQWKSLDLLAPMLILALLTLVFRLTDLDPFIESFFYIQGKGWVYADMNPWSFLYRYGTLPAIVLAVGSLLVFACSFLLSRFYPYRRKALFGVLLMLIGPGLIVNLIFKDHWGRPRPREVNIFSGQERFLPAWEKGISGNGRSFPCGHASMGFYLFSPFFVLRKTSRRWALCFLTLGIGYGAFMGLGRMIQGGHFASDVIWSGGFVYLCGWGLCRLLRLDRPTPDIGAGNKIRNPNIEIRNNTE